MARTRIPHHAEASGSLVTINPKHPTVAQVELYVDDAEREIYRTYFFSMPRRDLETLGKQIAQALREAPLPVRKSRASP